MKIFKFTIPFSSDKSFISKTVDSVNHYPHLHEHDEIQLTWIKEGNGTLIIGHDIHDYRAGDVFLIGPSLPHVFKSKIVSHVDETKNEFSALIFFFNPNQALHPLFSLPEMESASAFFRIQNKGFKVPNSTLENVIRAMTAVDNAMGPDRLVEFLKLIDCLTVAGCDYRPLSTESQTLSVPVNERNTIEQIYSYIHQNYNRAITLDEVAELASITPGAFCRYFKKHTGQTFVSFLNEVRINEACKKLVTHKFQNISFVASQCGFSSVTNFNRVFKSLRGFSPRYYVESFESGDPNTIVYKGPELRSLDFAMMRLAIR